MHLFFTDYYFRFGAVSNLRNFCWCSLYNPSILRTSCVVVLGCNCYYLGGYQKLPAQWCSCSGFLYTAPAGFCYRCFRSVLSSLSGNTLMFSAIVPCTLDGTDSSSLTFSHRLRDCRTRMCWIYCLLVFILSSDVDHPKTSSSYFALLVTMSFFLCLSFAVFVRWCCGLYFGIPTVHRFLFFSVLFLFVGVVEIPLFVSGFLGRHIRVRSIDVGVSSKSGG